MVPVHKPWVGRGNQRNPNKEPIRQREGRYLCEAKLLVGTAMKKGCLVVRVVTVGEPFERAIR